MPLTLSGIGTITGFSNTQEGLGLTLIASQSFSATTAVNVNNCFTTTYDNYRIIIQNLTADANRTLNIRWRASAADNSTSNYNYQYGYDSSTTSSGSRSTAQTSGVLGYASTTSGSFYVVDVFLPQAAAVTSALSLGGYMYAGPTLDSIRYFNNFSATTQFDGFSLFPSLGTITGTARVYGYRN